MSAEIFSLHQFGEVVPGHIPCGEVFNADLLLFDAVSDKKIPHVNVTVFLSTQIISVTLHEDGALVILVYGILIYLETLVP